MIANPTVSIDALVFDAYGTLFDVHSVAATRRALFPGRGAALVATLAQQATRVHVAAEPDAKRRASAARISRRSPRMRSTMRSSALGLAARAARARHRLLDAYLDAAPFPDAEPTLAALAPRPRSILSNGTRAMLEPLLRRPAWRRHLDAHPVGRRRGHLQAESARLSARRRRLAVAAVRIGFVSSNWLGRVGAKAFGFTAFWINRSRCPARSPRSGAGSHHRARWPIFRPVETAASR